MESFDSHAHLTSPEMLPSIDAILARASTMHILNICTDKNSLVAGLALAEQYPRIYNAGSTTPHDVAAEGELFFPLFQEAARNKKLVAIGETGLDYHYAHSPKDLQKKFLIQYLSLATECRLPVIFHCREAFSDLFAIADAVYPKNSPAILHCFTGNPQEAEGVLSRGWFLSLSGIITFKKSEELRTIAKEIPLSQLLLETDAPYLAPQSRRGKMNEPSFIAETALCIADLKGISTGEVLKKTTENAKNLFCRPR